MWDSSSPPSVYLIKVTLSICWEGENECGDVSGAAEKHREPLAVFSDHIRSRNILTGSGPVFSHEGLMTNESSRTRGHEMSALDLFLFRVGEHD